MDRQPDTEGKGWGWLSRLGPLLFTAAFAGPLVYIYGQTNQEDVRRACVKRGPPDSTASTPLQQAQQLSACIERQVNPVGRLFFEPTRRMLRSLPNAPSRWQGVWISEQYGSPYEFHLCADSRIRVRPAEDPTADDSWNGSWGVHEDRMLWFRNDRGPVLPAESLKLMGSDAGRFALTDDLGGMRHFERSGASPNCAPATA